MTGMILHWRTSVRWRNYLKGPQKAFVKNPTVEEINHAETLSLKMYRMVKMQIPSWQICARKLPWKNPDLLMMYLIHGKPHRLHERESIEGIFLIWA